MKYKLKRASRQTVNLQWQQRTSSRRPFWPCLPCRSCTNQPSRRASCCHRPWNEKMREYEEIRNLMVQALEPQSSAIGHLVASEREKRRKDGWSDRIFKFAPSSLLIRRGSIFVIIQMLLKFHLGWPTWHDAHSEKYSSGQRERDESPSRDWCCALGKGPPPAWCTPSPRNWWQGRTSELDACPRPWQPRGYLGRDHRWPKRPSILSLVLH